MSCLTAPLAPLFLSFLCAPQDPATAAANAAAPVPADAPIVIPFVEHPKQIMLAVTVNGEGPYDFTLDTGANIGVCLDAAVAKTLELPVTGQTENRGGTGRVVQRDLVGIEEVGLESVVFESQDAVVADYSWISPQGARAVDGILGFPLFSDRLLTIDHAAGEVRLERGALPEDGDHVVPDLGQDDRPHVALTIAATDERVTALLDTGGAGGIVLPDRLRESLELVSEPVVIGRMRSVNGLGGVVRQARLAATVRIAGHVLESPMVTFYEGRDRAVIGGRFLEDYVLTFDQHNRRVRIALPKKR